MTLPVQPPGGYHGGGGGSSRGFPHKRLPYGGGGAFIKKHPHMPPATAAGVGSGAAASTGAQVAPHQQPKQPSNAAAQASAVAAATTAVAAAKAAAQSAANAITNPGILAQVSKLPNIKQEDASEDSAGTPELAATATSVTAEPSTESLSSLPLESSLRQLKQEPKPNGELSEISDSDDDILNKTDKVKPKSELQLEGALAGNQEISTDLTVLSNSEEITKSDAQTIAQGSTQMATSGSAAGAQQASIKSEEVEEVLDFEEISDGELEEDARHKGKRR